MGKSKVNAYQVFVDIEYKKLQRAGQHAEYRDMFKKLGPIWSKLNEEEREPYKKEAESRNLGNRPSFGNPLPNPPTTRCPSPSLDLVVKCEPSTSATSSSLPSSFRTFDQHQSSWNEEVNQRPNMKRPRDDSEDVPRPVVGAPGIPSYKKFRRNREDSGLNAPLNVPIEEVYDEFWPYYLRSRDIVNDRSEEQLIDEVMYSFSANVMCGSVDGVYTPLEISVAAYSIDTGRLVKKPYHVMINPGTIPEGMHAQAKVHFPAHNIALPPYCWKRSRKDYRNIYEEILNYVGPEKVVQSYSENHIKQNIGAIRWLYLQTRVNDDLEELPNFEEPDEDLPDDTTWTVICISDYVYSVARRLNMKCRSIVHMMTEHLLNNEGELAPEHVCPYHRMQESRWCAQATAIRGFLLIQDLFKSFYTEFKNRKKAIEAPPPKTKQEPPQETASPTQHESPQPSSSVKIEYNNLADPRLAARSSLTRV